MMGKSDKQRESAMVNPIESLKIGDEIIGPFGRYHFKVTDITPDHVHGEYTKVPLDGYNLGQRCTYPKRDWNRAGGFQYAHQDKGNK